MKKGSILYEVVRWENEACELSQIRDSLYTTKEFAENRVKEIKEEMENLRKSVKYTKEDFINIFKLWCKYLYSEKSLEIVLKELNLEVISPDAFYERFNILKKLELIHFPSIIEREVIR